MNPNNLLLEVAPKPSDAVRFLVAGLRNPQGLRLDFATFGMYSYDPQENQVVCHGCAVTMAMQQMLQFKYADEIRRLIDEGEIELPPDFMGDETWDEQSVSNLACLYDLNFGASVQPDDYDLEEIEGLFNTLRCGSTTVLVEVYDIGVELPPLDIDMNNYNMRFFERDLQRLEEYVETLVSMGL